MTLSPPERSSPAELHEVQTEPDPLEDIKLGTFPPDCDVCSWGQNDDLPANMCFGDASDECPWVLRRRSTARHSAPKTLRVLRQPLGPDGAELQFCRDEMFLLLSGNVSAPFAPSGPEMWSGLPLESNVSRFLMFHLLVRNQANSSSS
ncbi:hypothetical protein FQA47_001901 [Oryzias melastigma]|uniref:Uncharacterized protein n=1 Tax=Oryzias melastigma TaxID=30732 RepID=A0A834FH27_ORYME|nr:hypothetical protein FQA47_001901 [Oryzias melastigma]